MQIIVDGRDAVLKQGSSFDFIAENRLFSGSDSYTLTITFPLKDCPQNIDIFGQIHRSEIVPQDITFDCEIRDKAFSRFGTLTITEISDIELKAQFLEGRAEQNFAKDFDESYINELDLGSYPSTAPADISPEDAWKPTTSDFECVALPWVSADSGVAHNFADYDADTESYKWSEDVDSLSWQPYLIHIVRKICDAVGYSCDLSQWEDDGYLSQLLLCNTLPNGWDISGYARALPHWTVAEFFEKLELFLRGEFTIDHRARHISFRLSHSVLEETEPVRIESVVDEYSSSIDKDGGKCEYMEAKPYRYADQDLQAWKYMSCDWFLKSWPEDDIVHYQDYKAMYDANKSLLSYNTTGGNKRGSSGNVGKLLHTEDMDMYYIIRNISRTDIGTDALGARHYIYRRTFQPVNEFGAYLPEGTDIDDAEEIEFVPAICEVTEDKYGYALFLAFSGYSESSGTSVSDVLNDSSLSSENFQKTGLQKIIESGAKESPSEYYDKIYIGNYTGVYNKGVLPYPLVSPVGLDKDGLPDRFFSRSLRINDPESPGWSPVYRIDRTRKVSFKFLSVDIPDPRALFFIRGRRYICEKITATFTEDGMSQLLKGEFWPLLDD